MAVDKLVGRWNYPTSIRFGAGRIGELPAACRELGMTAPLLVTDTGLAQLDIVARAVRQALSEGKALDSIDLSAFSPEFAVLPADYLAPANIVARKDRSFTRPAGFGK